MKKFLIVLLSLLIFTSCSTPNEEVEVLEPEQEPLYYSVPIHIMTKKSSGITTVEELNGKTLGIQTNFDKEYSDYVLEQLSGIEVKTCDCGSYQNLPNLIADNTIDAWVLPEGYDSVVNDYRSDYVVDDYISIGEYKKPYYEEKNIPEEILNDPLYNEPFAIMINGIDGADDTNESPGLRNDVNHLMVVDPKKRHVLTISFPRDSYIYNVTYNYYDKMTHMHVYGGAETIAASVGNLMDIEVPYYCVTSFSSFVNMINEFGGVWIDVPMDVYMDMDSNRDVSHPYEMSKGYKKCYGEWALALARNRKYNNIANSDYSRIRNQALIINSIIKRVADHPYILDMMGMSWLCNVLTHNNFSDSQIKTLLALAKTFNEGYTVDNYFIAGYGGMAGDASVSFMDDTSVEIAKEKIQLVFTGIADKDSPYYEDVMTGYITGGAGTLEDGDYLGYIGETYDLNTVYPQANVQ